METIITWEGVVALVAGLSFVLSVINYRNRHRVVYELKTIFVDQSNKEQEKKLRICYKVKNGILLVPLHPKVLGATGLFLLE